MIKRIVKMSFTPGGVEEFLSIYHKNWERIRSFDGCSHVELLRDKNDPSLFFTYSNWESEEKLNAYRESELFTSVWNSVKVLFDARPEAWSVETFEP